MGRICNRKRGIQRRMRSKWVEVVFEMGRWRRRRRWRRRLGWGQVGGEEENGRDQEFLSNLITWPKKRFIQPCQWKASSLNLSVYHLSKLFSGPPVEVEHTGRALQTDSPVITNVVLPDYQPIVGGVDMVFNNCIGVIEYFLNLAFLPFYLCLFYSLWKIQY